MKMTPQTKMDKQHSKSMLFVFDSGSYFEKLHYGKLLALVLSVSVFGLLSFFSNLETQKKIEQFFFGGVRTPSNIGDTILLFNSVPSGGSFFTPPFGEITLYDFKSGDIQDITTNEYFDSSPSFSPVMGAIYFVSRRPTPGGIDHALSNPSRLYKVVISEQIEIRADQDIKGALKYSDSEIKSAVVPEFNDSLIFFMQNDINREYFITGYNMLSKKIVIDIRVNGNESFIPLRNGLLITASDVKRGMGRYKWYSNLDMKPYELDSILNGFWVLNSTQDGHGQYLYKRSEGITEVSTLDFGTFSKKKNINIPSELNFSVGRCKAILRCVLDQNRVIVVPSKGVPIYHLYEIDTEQLERIGESDVYTEKLRLYRRG